MSKRIVKECICGADIYQERGSEDWFNVHDAMGTALYCYPDAEGQDGAALHEPLEDAEAYFFLASAGLESDGRFRVNFACPYDPTLTATESLRRIFEEGIQEDSG